MKQWFWAIWWRYCKRRASRHKKLFDRWVERAGEARLKAWRRK